MNSQDTLHKQLTGVLEETGCEWLEQSLKQLSHLDGDIETVANRLVFYTGSAAKKLGSALLRGDLSSGLSADSYGECGQLFLDHWTATDAARVLFLKRVMDTSALSRDELFQLCYRYSDEAERAALLKGLALLDISPALTDFVIDVARTNSLALFSALMYRNPWPAAHFSPEAYNQVVLKSLFMGVDISQIPGLRAARNPELGRMTADYVQERLDAGRSVPVSIWLVVDACRLGEEGIDAWLEALRSNEKNHRQLAKLGCEWQAELPPRLQTHHS